MVTPGWKRAWREWMRQQAVIVTTKARKPPEGRIAAARLCAGAVVSGGRGQWAGGSAPATGRGQWVAGRQRTGDRAALQKARAMHMTPSSDAPTKQNQYIHHSYSASASGVISKVTKPSTPPASAPSALASGLGAAGAAAACCWTRRARKDVSPAALSAMAVPSASMDGQVSVRQQRTPLRWPACVARVRRLKIL